MSTPSIIAVVADKSRASIPWGIKLPTDVRDYALDISASIDAESDTLGSAFACVSPWGPGELNIDGFSITSSQATPPQWLATCWLSSGVPGRTYKVWIQATAANRQGEFEARVINFIATISIDMTLLSGPAPPIVHPGFGTASTWPSGSLSGSTLRGYFLGPVTGTFGG